MTALERTLLQSDKPVTLFDEIHNKIHLNETVRKADEKLIKSDLEILDEAHQDTVFKVSSQGRELTQIISELETLRN